MKRRILTILLMAGFLLCLAPMPTGAASTPYFLVVNDDLPDSSVYNTPIYINGITYIPCTVFDPSYVKGVPLGVTYVWDKERDILSLNSASSNTILDFNIATGAVTDYPGKNEYNYQPAVARNGLVYVPAWEACGYFGLSVSSLPTNNCTVLRIKNSNAVLDDNAYILSARPMLDVWVNRYFGESSSPSGGDDTPKPPDDDPLEQDPGDRSSIYVSVALSKGENADGLLQTMRQRGAKGVFFFPGAELSGQTDSIIDIVGQGSHIGLIAAGSTAQAQVDSVLSASKFLSELLHQRMFFVLNDGLDENAAAQLREAGYILWSPRMTLNANGRGSSQIYNTALDQIHAATGTTRLLVYDDVPAGTLSSILRQLKEESYTLLPSRETAY